MHSNKPLTPKWWHHNTQSWEEICKLFPLEQLLNQASWQKLELGLSNDNYKITIGDLSKQSSQQSEKKSNDYFVQVISHKNRILLPKKNHPKNLIQLTHCENLKTWLVKCLLNSPSIRIFDWFEPSDLNSQIKLTDKKYLDEFIDFLSRLHQNKITTNSPRLFTTLNIQQHLTDYKIVALKKSPDSKNIINTIFENANKLKTDFKADTLCHNDLSPSNLLWGHQNELKVIDWEYVCYSDLTMELAGIIINYQLNEQQELLLISHYEQQNNIEISSKKLQSMKSLYHYLTRLWQLCL